MSDTKRWIAREATRVGELLAQMKLARDEARAAIDGGRVFVGRRRARTIEDAVGAGEEVLLHTERASVTLPTPFVLHHARGVLAVDKPAGMPTIADLQGAAGSLVDVAARAIGVSASALQVTSRLDRDVSGAVLFALDHEAAEAIAVAREQGRYLRRYVAIAVGALPADRGRWSWAIARDRDPMRRCAVEEGDPTAKAAASRFLVVRRARLRDLDFALLALAPETGRTHQLRVHAARAGAPLLGDGAYGGARRVVSANGTVRTLERIALHCAAVEVARGRTAVPEGSVNCNVSVRSPVPRELRELASFVGLVRADDDDAFEEAIRCDV